MSNKMPKIADLLGVKLGEVFFIKEYPSYSRMYLKFTENGLEQSLDKDSWTKAASWVWEQLITGALKINKLPKLPWKPKMNEEFYVPCIHYTDSSMATKFRWRDDNADNKFYQFGIVCMTRGEAIALTKKMLKLAEKTMTQEAKENG